MPSKYQISTLAENKELAKDVITLVSQAFDYPQSENIIDDFPYLFSSTNYANNIIVTDENKVVAHIGVCPRLWGLESASIPVTLLGGIAVHPKYRGQGLMKLAMDDVFRRYKDTSMYILWSNQSDLYRKFDFYEAGGIRVCDVGDNGISLKDKTFDQLDENEIGILKNSYNNFQKQYLTLRRTDKDWELIKKTKKSKIYIKDQDYFVIGKGFDLPNIVHEYSANLESQNLFDQLPKSTLWSPDYESSPVNADTKIFLAMFRIGNQSSLNKFMNFYSGGKITIKDVAQGKIVFEYCEMIYENSCEEFLQIIFGPGRVEEFSKFLRPICIQGLDSI